METKKATRPVKRILSLILIFATLTLMVAVFGVFFYRGSFRNFLTSETQILGGYVKEVSANLKRSLDFSKEYEKIQDKRYFGRLSAALLNWKYMADRSAWEIYDSQNIDFNNLNGCVVDADFNHAYTFGSTPISLSEEEMAQLIEKGRYRTDSKYYMTETAKGYRCFIMCEKEAGESDPPQIALSGNVPYLILNNATDEILYSGYDYTDGALSNLSLSELTGNPLSTEGDIAVYAVARPGETYLTATQRVTIDEASFTVCVYSDFGKLKSETLDITLILAGMLELFSVFCVVLLVRLFEKRFDENGESAQKGSAPLRRYSFKRRVFSALAAMGAAVFLMANALYFLDDVMFLHDEIGEALDNLTALNENSKENRAIIGDEIDGVVEKIINDIELAVHYEYDVSTDALLSELANTFEVDEFTVYDGEGIITASSGPYKGYCLSKDPADDEYKLWSLINGGIKYISFASSTDDSWYVATRRTDTVGIILLKSNNKTLKPLLEKTEFADLLALQNYPNANTMYSKRDEPGIVYVLNAGKTTEAIRANGVVMPSDGETHIGLWKAEGKNYLYINLGWQDWVAMYAYPMKELAHYMLLFALVFLIDQLIIGAAVFLLWRWQKKNIVPEADTTLCVYKTFAEERDKLLHIAFSAVSLTTMLHLLFQAVFYEDGTLLYRFMDKWEKSVNLISVVYVLLLLGIFMGVFRMISILQILVRRWLSSKQSTVVSLLGSFAKAVLIAYCAIESLEQFGVNAITITASLGLTGVALGIGSKDVISDLVAGVFIILEGKIQIGDVISVNGFFGIVQSLDIRTTTVRLYNEEMICNNSGLKNIKNLSRGDARVRISITLPFDTDLNRLESIINANAERFNKSCNGILLSPPVFDGVSAYTDYGMECYIRTFTACAYQIRAGLLLRTELMKVLAENGIQPAQKIIICRDLPERNSTETQK